MTTTTIIIITIIIIIIIIIIIHDVMSRRSRVALAPVYGGLPVRLYSHLATAVHQVAGDPGMVHHLVHTSIRSYWILASHWLIQQRQYSPLIG